MEEKIFNKLLEEVETTMKISKNPDFEFISNFLIAQVKPYALYTAKTDIYKKIKGLGETEFNKLKKFLKKFGIKIVYDPSYDEYIVKK